MRDFVYLQDYELANKKYSCGGGGGGLPAQAGIPLPPNHFNHSSDIKMVLLQSHGLRLEPMAAKFRRIPPQYYKLTGIKPVWFVIAEEVGFEPTVRLLAQRFSRAPPSTSQPLLQSYIWQGLKCLARGRSGFGLPTFRENRKQFIFSPLSHSFI